MLQVAVEFDLQQSVPGFSGLLLRTLNQVTIMSIYMCSKYSGSPNIVFQIKFLNSNPVWGYLASSKRISKLCQVGKQFYKVLLAIGPHKLWYSRV